MTERAWKHRFVQALYEILLKETGLPRSKCLDMALDEVNNAWLAADYGNPERNARECYDQMRKPQTV